MFTKPFKSHTRSKPELFKGIFYTMPEWNFLLKERNNILRLEKSFSCTDSQEGNFEWKWNVRSILTQQNVIRSRDTDLKFQLLKLELTFEKLTVPGNLQKTVVSTSWYCHRSISSVQLSSVAQSCPTLQPHGLQHIRLPCLSLTSSLLKLMSIESVVPSNHLILCHPLLLLPSVFPSIRVFSKESALHIRWPKYWSFSFSISPFNEYSGLISFRIDWLNLLAVQGTHKSLLQHCSSKASILQCSAFFMVQLLPPY